MRNKNSGPSFIKSARPGDIVIFAICAGIILFLSFRIYGKNSGSEMVEIRMKKEVWIYPLDKDRTIELQTEQGHIVIEIDENTVFVRESSCKEQICVRSGAVSKPGQWIACLPAGVLISVISNNDKDGPDETSY